MIEYNEVILKIKEGNFLFRDKEGDTLLHSLAGAEEYMHVPVEPVLALLIKYPHLADTKNKLGQTPGEILDGCQLHSHTSNRPFRRLLHQYVNDKKLKENLEKSIDISFIEQLDENANSGYRVISSIESDSILKSQSTKSFLLFSKKNWK